MKRRTEAQWRDLFAEHEASGLSTLAFCRERSLNTQYFGKRRKQLLKDDSIKTSASFVAVAVIGQSTATMVVLQLGGTLTLKIPASVSTAWLVELIKQLQA